MQTRTAVADPFPYTQNMLTDFVKAALIGAWVLAIGAFGYMPGTASFAGWTLLAVVSLAPPALAVRLRECAASDHVGDYSERTSLM